MDEVISQVVELLRGMWRRRWIGVAVAWVAVVIGIAFVSRVPERYEATARIYVDTQTLLKPLLSGLAVQPDVDQQVAMLARTLITRPNMEKLIVATDMDTRLKSRGEREALIDMLVRDIRFSSGGRFNLYDVSFRDTDPAEARAVVQKLVSMFVESGLGDKRKDTESAQRFIDEQIRIYDKRLQEAEGRLRDFRLKHFSTLTGGQDYIGKMSTLAEDLNKVRLELKVAEQSRDQLKRELAGEEPVLLPDTPAAGTVSVPEIDARIETQKRQLDELLRRYTDEHPDVLSAQRMVARLEEQRREEIARRSAARGGKVSVANNPVFQQIKVSLSEAENTVVSLRARAGELQARLDTLRSSANRIPQVEAELAQLNRDYDVIRQNYQALVSRRESASLTSEVDNSASLAEFRVIDPPRVSDKPVFPTRRGLALLVLLAALAAGAGACFVVLQLFPTVHTTRTLKEIVGRPVLGVVSIVASPVIARQQRRSLLLFGGALAGLIAVHGAWVVWLTISARS